MRSIVHDVGYTVRTIPGVNQMDGKEPAVKVIAKGDWPTEQGTKTTGTVTIERILAPQHSGGAALERERFEDGTVTHWHTHPGEQILVVLEGQGRGGTESERFTFGVGDIIYAPPGERHWHGAAAGSSLTTLDFRAGGPAVWENVAPQLDNED